MEIKCKKTNKLSSHVYSLNSGIGAILCNLEKDSVVLNYGSDNKNVEKFISNYAGKIISMDTNNKDLSFAENYFDLIIINGNLPKNQLKFLKQIRIMLKPIGQLLIGVENQNKIISFNFYNKLLKNAGFTDISIDIPFPSYKKINQIFLNKNLSCQKFVNNNNFKGKVKNLFLKTGLIKYFANSYLIHTNSNQGSFIEKVLNLNNEKPRDVISIINQNNKFTCLIFTKNFIYKISTSPVGSKHLKKEVEIVNDLATNHHLIKFLPKIKYQVINGMNLQIIQKENQILADKNYLNQVNEFLMIKNRLVIQKNLSEVYELNNIKKYLEYNNQSSLFEGFIKFVGNEAIGCSLTHGDFHSNNIIPTSNGIKIIDWEFFTKLAPKEIDYINLILYEETFLTKRRYFDVVEEFLEGRLKLSKNNKFKKYQHIISSILPSLKLLYVLQNQDFIISRYEQIDFIPSSKNIKIKKIIDLLEGYIFKNV